MKKILLISNPNHMGIRQVADGYKKAFEHLGVDFNYFSFREEPAVSPHEANALIQWKLSHTQGRKIIFIQPSYLMADTYTRLTKYREHGFEFYCINTEDPYSTYAILQIQDSFKIKFTNEEAVADKFKQLNFKYLPVAFDSLLPYKHSFKNIDLSFVSSFYQNRIAYLEWLKKVKVKKYIAGTMAPMFTGSTPLDITSFSRTPELIPKHTELEIYGQSRFVMNPHRDPTYTGKTFLSVGDGILCPTVVEEARSPNPRFFDAIGCGAIPLSDRSRTGCIDIIKKYIKDETFINKTIIPDDIDFENDIQNRINTHIDNDSSINELKEEFLDNETYINRAATVLKEIGYES